MEVHKIWFKEDIFPLTWKVEWEVTVMDYKTPWSPILKILYKCQVKTKYSIVSIFLDFIEFRKLN